MKLEGISAYPLCWPKNRIRSTRKLSAKFRTTFAKARDELIKEIIRLGGSNLVISTNIQLRKDGLPYADRREPEDSGVAIYFYYKRQQMCFACDKWQKVADNMQAITKTIESLRGIARWGSGDMMESAFSGFTALPNSSVSSSWRDILGLNDRATLSDAERAYKELRSKHHPDKGGNAEMFNAVQNAWEIAKQILSN